MPVLNRIAGLADEMTEWRQWLHQNPELGFDCFDTSNFVAARLEDFGADAIHRGIAKTGIVAIIEGSAPGPTIGLRADMDALPIKEATGADYASTREGKMHACGHDGHTTMLLGAAKYLSETRNFAGRVALIFQPAEEDGGGGGVMVDEGILDRFDITEVYALHNLPGLDEGLFSTTPGPINAAVDTFDVTLHGVGGHAAMPHTTVDPVAAALALGQALQTLVSRVTDPVEDLVVSVTQLRAGHAENVVPNSAWICGTVRTFDPDIRDQTEASLRQIVAGTAAAFGVTADVGYARHYPATVNDATAVGHAAKVAMDVSGKVRTDATRQMWSEDFSYLLQERPGAYLFLGAGEGHGLHHSGFDFNDRISPIGASWFARMIESRLPLAL